MSVVREMANRDLQHITIQNVNGIKHFDMTNYMIYE